MSSALVRQALEFVDQEESVSARRERSTGHKHRSSGQGNHSYKNKGKKTVKPTKAEEQTVEENIKKLLALSEAIAEKDITKTIIERAVKGKPLIEKPKIQIVEEKSILFPEDDLDTNKTKKKLKRKRL